jgi:hypothetical protein
MGADRSSLVLVLALAAALAGSGRSQAGVTYALVVDPVRSPGSKTADVRVILEDYDTPRPFRLDINAPFLQTPDTGVAVRMSHLKSTFAEIGLVDLAGDLTSRNGSTIDGGHLTGSYAFPDDPNNPFLHAGVFVSMDCGLLSGPVQLTVIGPSHEVETIYGRFELMSPSANPAPSGVVLLGIGLAGVGASRALGRGRDRRL